MKILFHANTLNYRGTTVAVTDYARYNQEILGNESVIIYDESIRYEEDMGTELKVLYDLKRQFNVVGYKKNQIQKVIDKQKADAAYFIRAGNKEPLPTNIKTCVHSVFQFNEPHGDRYAYISEWLSNKMSNGRIPYVPHIVDIRGRLNPEICKTLKSAALKTPYSNIENNSFNKIIVGRIGGWNTFDIPFVRDVVLELADTDKFYFWFTGTAPFSIPHRNIIFSGNTNVPGMKALFMETCDVMLHGRMRGESFGLSIAEFLSFNRPVLAWNDGLDQNHMEMLKNSGLLYNNAKELKEMLWNALEYKNKEDWTKRVEQYKPLPVMTKFKEVFL
jgi:hypothetical protein